MQRVQKPHQATDQDGDDGAEVVNGEVWQAKGFGLWGEQCVGKGEAAGGNVAVHTRVRIQQLLKVLL